MDPDKVKAVMDWPLPKNASEMRSFLGLCNHYKRFIEGYSTKIGNLSELQQATKPFDLADAKYKLARQEYAWPKQAITSAPILAVYYKLMLPRDCDSISIQLFYL